MTRDYDLSEGTVEDFRHDAAGPQPAPAGVAIAAVSASFALALVVKVLAISGRRDPTRADTAGIEPFTATAQAASQRMLRLASDDSAAFDAFLTARRLPHATESEYRARQEDIDSAVRRTIEVPLAAAQEAAAGLELCSEVSAFTSVAVIADLGVAAALLASALRGFLLCAESNIRQLAPDAASYRERLATETSRHEQALRQAQAVLERAAAALKAAPGAGNS